jgi:hypothetical protein
VIAGWHESLPSGALPDRDFLRRIAQAHSPDYAALFFADCVVHRNQNVRLHDSFNRHLEGGEFSAAERAACAHFRVLYVPGWDYVSNGKVTGADLARPRQLTGAMGLESILVEIDPHGSVEANARTVQSAFDQNADSGRQLIVVSASSAGPAVHMAISRAAATNRPIPAAWINLGGILQGSPLIEYIRRPPQSLLFFGYTWWKGWDRNAVASMGAEVSRARFKSLRIPADVLVINYVGLSLSGSLSRYARDKYRILVKDGPNDGLTPLADIVAPNSLTLIAPLSDHFFAEDPRIDQKTVALAKTVVATLQTRGRSTHRP